MSLDISQVNWLAVLVSAIAAFMVGGVWYAALFGKAWARLHGYEDEATMKKMQQSQGKVFGLFFVSELVMGAAIAVLLTAFPDPTWRTGLMLGLLGWLGIGLPETAMQNAAHRKPMAAFVIDASHQLVYLVVVGVILGSWR